MKTFCYEVPKLKKYELIKDGCLYDSCYAKSIRKARDIFSGLWEGNFIIISDYDESKNVRLK